MGSGIHGVQNVVFPLAWAKFVSKCSHKYAFPPSRAIFDIVMDKIRKTPYLVPRTKHTPFPWLPLDCIAFHGFPDQRRVREGKTRFCIWPSLGGINEGPRVQLRIKDNRCMHVRIDDWRKEKERL